jgi:hypothetical protein
VRAEQKSCRRPITKSFRKKAPPAGAGEPFSRSCSVRNAKPQVPFSRGAASEYSRIPLRADQPIVFLLYKYVSAMAAYALAKSHRQARPSPIPSIHPSIGHTGDNWNDVELACDPCRLNSFCDDPERLGGPFGLLTGNLTVHGHKTSYTRRSIFRAFSRCPRSKLWASVQRRMCRMKLRSKFKLRYSRRANESRTRACVSYVE